MKNFEQFLNENDIDADLASASEELDTLMDSTIIGITESIEDGEKEGEYISILSVDFGGKETFLNIDVPVEWISQYDMHRKSHEKARDSTQRLEAIVNKHQEKLYDMEAKYKEQAKSVILECVKEINAMRPNAKISKKFGI